MIEALYKNRNTRMSTADRLIEFAARNHLDLSGIPAFKDHVEALQGQLIPEPSEEPLPQDQAFAQSLAVDGEGDADGIFEEDGEGGEVVKEQFKPLSMQIAEMSKSEKLRFAMVGSKAARAILVRDHNKQVSYAAISSPQMTAAEAAEIAKSKDVGEDILRYIGNKKDWIKSGEVKHNLVFNSKCPVGISLRFLGHMRVDELRNARPQPQRLGADPIGRGATRATKGEGLMSLFGKLLGRRNLAEERAHADELHARAEYGLAKLAYERALGLARGEPEAVRAELKQRAVDCCDAIARVRIAEGDRLLQAGERELAMAEFQGAADTAASAALVSDAVRRMETYERSDARAKATLVEQSDDERFETIAGSFEEDQYEEYTGHGPELRAALLALYDGKASAARPVLERLLEGAQAPRYLLFEIGRARLLDGEGPGGRDALTRFVALFGEGEGGEARLVAHMELAALHDEAGDLEAAAAEYEAAVEAMPDDPRPHLAMAVFFRKAKLPAEAIDVLDHGDRPARRGAASVALHARARPRPRGPRSGRARDRAVRGRGQAPDRAAPAGPAARVRACGWPCCTRRRATRRARSTCTTCSPRAATCRTTSRITARPRA